MSSDSEESNTSSCTDCDEDLPGRLLPPENEHLEVNPYRLENCLSFKISTMPFEIK